jgi:hypothetical protein
VSSFLSTYSRGSTENAVTLYNDFVGYQADCSLSQVVWSFWVNVAKFNGKFQTWEIPCSLQRTACASTRTQQFILIAAGETWNFTIYLAMLRLLFIVIWCINQTKSAWCLVNVSVYCHVLLCSSFLTTLIRDTKHNVENALLPILINLKNKTRTIVWL